MKKTVILSMLTLALLLKGAVPVQAQQQETTPRSYWYGQAQMGLGYHVGEASMGKLLSPAAQLSVGRQFSPLFGLRLGATGWTARNWQVAPAKEYDWKYVQASLDATLSLSNLLLGSDAGRRWNVSALVGAGLNAGFGNDDANVLAAGHPTEFSKVWDGTLLLPTGRMGVAFDYALSKRIALGLEYQANFLHDKWNSKSGKNDNVDWQQNLLLGIRVTLGKTDDSRTEEEEVVVVEPEVMTEPEVLTEPESEPEVAPEPEPQPEAAPQETEGVKIYFKFDSSRILNMQAEKLRKLALFLKSHPDSTVKVKGYACQRGTTAYNKNLSRWRAEAVKACLQSYGVEAGRIHTEAMGEVNLGSERESRSALCITIE